mmetsp:Transcript_3734/g.17126  ORF Transcript_3734/g.17126 Transcript_3734/m.17126 type:complete len:235 (-) Transcript_3734:2136-2840(-)
MRPPSKDARVSSSHSVSPFTSPHAASASQTASSSSSSTTSDTDHPCSPTRTTHMGATSRSASHSTSSEFAAVRIAVRTSAVFGTFHPTCGDRSVAAAAACDAGSDPSHPRTSAASLAAGSTSHAKWPWSSAARRETPLASHPPPLGRPAPDKASGPSRGASERDPAPSTLGLRLAPAFDGAKLSSSRTRSSSSSSSPTSASSTSSSACRSAPAMAPTDHAPVFVSATSSSSTLG